jgi:hypothetical protein
VTERGDRCDQAFADDLRAWFVAAMSQPSGPVGPPRPRHVDAERSERETPKPTAGRRILPALVAAAAIVTTTAALATWARSAVVDQNGTPSGTVRSPVPLVAAGVPAAVASMCEDFAADYPSVSPSPSANEVATAASSLVERVTALRGGLDASVDAAVVDGGEVDRLLDATGAQVAALSAAATEHRTDRVDALVDNIDGLVAAVFRAMAATGAEPCSQAPGLRAR